MSRPTPIHLDENTLSGAGVAIEVAPFTDFDWDELMERLGEPRRTERDYAELSEILCRLFANIVQIDPKTARGKRLSTVGTRVISMAYALRPAMLMSASGSASPSEREVCEWYRVNRCTLQADLHKLRKLYHLTIAHPGTAAIAPTVSRAAAQGTRGSGCSGTCRRTTHTRDTRAPAGPTPRKELPHGPQWGGVKRGPAKRIARLHRVGSKA